jgi:hypothetical protein
MSWAFALKALTAASTVTSIGASIYSGVQSKKAGKELEKQYKKEQELTRLASEQEAEAIAAEAEDAKRRQISAAVANGMSVNSGSLRAIMRSSDASTEEALKRNKLNSQLNVEKYGYAASQAKIQGQSGFYGSLASAASYGFDGMKTGYKQGWFKSLNGKTA